MRCANSVQLEWAWNIAERDQLSGNGGGGGSGSGSGGGGGGDHQGLLRHKVEHRCLFHQAGVQGAARAAGAQQVTSRLSAVPCVEHQQPAGCSVPAEVSQLPSRKARRPCSSLARCGCQRCGILPVGSAVSSPPVWGKQRKRNGGARHWQGRRHQLAQSPCWCWAARRQPQKKRRCVRQPHVHRLDGCRSSRGGGSEVARALGVP